MRKILLAVDGSSHAEEAARFLSRLPHDQELEITILTVVQSPFIDRNYPTARWFEEVFDREKSAAVETYKKVEQIFSGANATVRHELLEGNPGQTIVYYAKKHAVELVVLGARGQSKVSRILLGSTSDHVATHASCSVLVVRPGDSLDSDPPLRIAIGYDDSAPAQAALKEFNDILSSAGADVHVVSILCCLYGFFGEIQLNSEIGPDSAAGKDIMAALNEAVRQLRDAAPNAQPHLIESEHIGEGLVQFVKDYQCDLVVVGETPRSSVGRVLLGSVSRFVLRHAPCSVWIARNQMIQQKSESEKSDDRTTQ